MNEQFGKKWFVITERHSWGASALFHVFLRKPGMSPENRLFETGESTCPFLPQVAGLYLHWFIARVSVCGWLVG